MRVREQNGWVQERPERKAFWGQAVNRGSHSQTEAEALEDH